MFKVGDIIKLKSDDFNFYDEFELNRLVYVEDIVDQSFIIIPYISDSSDSNFRIKGVRNGNEYTISSIDSLDFKMDQVYLRKQKLKKLCLK